MNFPCINVPTPSFDLACFFFAAAYEDVVIDFLGAFPIFLLDPCCYRILRTMFSCLNVVSLFLLLFLFRCFVVTVLSILVPRFCERFFFFTTGGCIILPVNSPPLSGLGKSSRDL